jgi:hypothetical protein
MFGVFGLNVHLYITLTFAVCAVHVILRLYAEDGNIHKLLLTMSDFFMTSTIVFCAQSNTRIMIQVCQ